MLNTFFFILGCVVALGTFAYANRIDRCLKGLPVHREEVQRLITCYAIFCSLLIVAWLVFGGVLGGSLHGYGIALTVLQLMGTALMVKELREYRFYRL